MELDRGYGTLARLAMIVLSTDETIEKQARLVLQDRPVSLVHSRVPAHADVIPETVNLMEAALVAACQALGVRSLAYVSPYVPSVTQPMRLFLAGHGIDTLVETGLPVISSNQALLWHMLKLAGVDATGWGAGRLFEV